MRRRNFFAVLLAPLLARFAPKPLTRLNLLPFEFQIKAESVSAMNAQVRLLLDLRLRRHLMYECSTGSGFVKVTEKWHKDAAPFVKIDIPERWPWEVE